MGTTEIDQVDIQTVPEPLVPGPRVALLTPYSGGNLGDAAIQDSMISNLRQRMPGVQFLGNTLNCENFLKHHGIGAFPLLATMMPIGGRTRASAAETANGLRHSAIKPENPKSRVQSRRIRGVLRRVPGLLPAAKRVRPLLARCRQEMRHSLAGYRVLRSQDLLLFSGGGQVDEEYGGEWRRP